MGTAERGRGQIPASSGPGQLGKAG